MRNVYAKYLMINADVLLKNNLIQIK